MFVLKSPGFRQWNQILINTQYHLVLYTNTTTLNAWEPPWRAVFINVNILDIFFVSLFVSCGVKRKRWWCCCVLGGLIFCTFHTIIFQQGSCKFWFCNKKNKQLNLCREKSFSSNAFIKLFLRIFVFEKTWIELLNMFVSLMFSLKSNLTACTIVHFQYEKTNVVHEDCCLPVSLWCKQKAWHIFSYKIWYSTRLCCDSSLGYQVSASLSVLFPQYSIHANMLRTKLWLPISSNSQYPFSVFLPREFAFILFRFEWRGTYFATLQAVATSDCRFAFVASCLAI